MQVQPRIPNPFMPSGTADKTNAPLTDFPTPGEIGCVFTDQNIGAVCLRVQLKSTSATPAAGTLAFWADRANNIVTATKTECDVGATGAINRVAGVFQLAVTPGNVCDIVVQKLAMSLVSADNSGVAGGVALANTAAAPANNVVGAAAVTTAPVSQIIGVNKAIPAANVAIVDVHINSIV